jgi:hypothetical protein
MHKNNESTPKSKENTTKKKKKKKREREKKIKKEKVLEKYKEAGLFGNKLKLKNHKNKKWIRD